MAVGPLERAVAEGLATAARACGYQYPSSAEFGLPEDGRAALGRRRAGRTLR